MIDVSGTGAFLGLDVGKGEHHATAVTPAGKKAFDKRLPDSEPKLRIDVGDGRWFPSAAHLAAYAGLAPATRSSGSSIRGEQPSRKGNKQLERAFFLSAFAALADPVSRAYYDKKISQGKHHTQALLCLARRRADVLFAVLRDGTFYEPQPAPSA